MIGEITLALGVADKAYKTIKTAIERGKDLNDMSATLGKFFTAQEQISEANVASRERSKTARLIAGKSIEEQALEIAMAKKKMETYEKELKMLLIYTNNGDVYREMLKQRRILKTRKLEQARIDARRKADVQDILMIALGLGVSVAMVFVMIGFIAQVNANPELYI